MEEQPPIALTTTDKKKRLAPLLILLIGAILTGCIYGLPDVLAMYLQKHDPKLQGQTFVPFPVRGASALHYDMSFYAGYINSMAHNGASLMGYDIWDPQSGRKDILPVALIALHSQLVKVVGGVDNLFVISSFVLPAVAFVLTFLFLRMFIPQLWLAAAAAIFAMFMNSWPPFVPLILQLKQLATGHWTFSDGHRPLYEFSRIISSQTAYPYLVLTWIAILAAMKDKRWWLTLPAGLLLGGLAYTYFYHASAMGVATVVLLAGLLVSRDRLAAKRVLIIMGVAVLVIVPAGIRYYMTHKAGGQDLVNAGVLLTREAVINKRELLLIALYLLVFRGKGQIFWLLFSCALSIQLCLNIQVVTGYTVEPDHWPNTTGKFLDIFIYAHMISYLWTVWIPRRGIARALQYAVNAFIVGVAAVSVVYATYVHVDSTRRIYPAMTISAAARAAYAAADELNRTAPGVMVAPSQENICYLRIYTNVKVGNAHSWGSLNSTEARRKPLLAAMALLNYPEEDLAADMISRHAQYFTDTIKTPAGLDQNAFERSLFVFRVWKGNIRFKNFPGSWKGLTDKQVQWLQNQSYESERILPESEQAQTLREFRECKADPLGALRAMGVRYLFLGPWERGLPGGKLSMDGLKTVFDNGEYQILEIGPRS